VDVLFDQLTTSIPLLSAGKLKALAVTTRDRSSLLPQVPTLAESGLRDYEISTYTALMLPAATPKDVVAKVQQALVQVLDRPATRDAFARLGADALRTTPQTVAKSKKGKTEHDCSGLRPRSFADRNHISRVSPVRWFLRFEMA
jgi:tripartite-type tricarboxylate transporter receptor subunit TctC